MLSEWQPHFLVVLSGKRKTGKYYVSSKILNIIDKLPRIQALAITFAKTFEDVVCKRSWFSFELLAGFCRVQRKLSLETNKVFQFLIKTGINADNLILVRINADEKNRLL